jgi:signal transduction histidine kinase
VHLESGQLELNPTRIDLASLATEAVDRIRISAPGFELKLDTPGEPVIGEWDRNRMNQVLDNLLLNAVKYSPDGGCITVQVSADENTAELRVSDHGVGITQELQKRLFTRFYRADEAGVASGLGLGLYISRMLVEAHGGTIRVDSRPAAGSVFTVNVPRQFPRD